MAYNQTRRPHSSRFWEEVAANTMPSFAHLLYDGWLLRFTEGYSRHNNSVWPLYEGERPLAEKLAFCEAQYAARGSTCGFRLTEMPEHETMDALLTERGYGRSNPNLIMVRNSVAGSTADVTESGMDDWLDTIYRIRPGDPAIKAWERKVYERLALPSRYVVVVRDGAVGGYGRSVQQGDILTVMDLWVQLAYRRQGVATQLVHGLFQLGRRDGATTASVGVNQDNDNARRLYERLGFVNRYLYWYRVSPLEAD